MKNLYCFNCQKDVQPKEFFGLRFCPDCRHRLTDSGEGFYLVCDNCGANNALEASKCVKCGSFIANGANTDLEAYSPKEKPLSVIIDCLIVLGGIAFSILVLYISFYLLLALFALGGIWYLFSQINRKR